jgi:hypothetical protein
MYKTIQKLNRVTHEYTTASRVFCVMSSKL